MSIISILNKANRTGNFSATFKVPDNLVVDKIIVTTNSDIAELQDDTRTLTFNLYVSDDGTSWKHHSGFTYIGHVEEVKSFQPQPGLVVPLSRFIGKWAKVECSINKAWKIGLQVDME